MSSSRCWEKKDPRYNILEDLYHAYIWKPLFGECLQYVKQLANEVDKNAVAVVPTDSQCIEEVFGQVQ